MLLEFPLHEVQAPVVQHDVMHLDDPGRRCRPGSRAACPHIVAVQVHRLGDEHAQRLLDLLGGARPHDQRRLILWGPDPLHGTVVETEAAPQRVVTRCHPFPRPPDGSLVVRARSAGRPRTRGTGWDRRLERRPTTSTPARASSGRRSSLRASRFACKAAELGLVGLTVRGHRECAEGPHRKSAKSLLATGSGCTRTDASNGFDDV